MTQPFQESENPQRKGWVVYEDDWLLVVNKPAGLLTIPTPRKEKRTLISLLNDEAQKKQAAYRLHPCHRLDRQTSGLIIFAKGKSTQKKIMQGFKTRQIKKTYLALVNGNLPRTDGQIKIPLQEGCALTEYKVISRRKDFDLVEVRPVTGRTNQIRLHFKALGHPVLGDDRFAFRRDFRLKAKRLMLYAKELEFMHPVTGRPIHLRLDLNKELREFLTSHS